MALRINLNTAALNAHRQLNNTDKALEASIERLSSGFRINRAADDPAGLAISENLRAQVSGLGQAIANSSDAVNMIRTAEASLSEVHTQLRTMRDLALHASNTGANDSTAIDADQAQMTSSLAAIDRIAENTQFGNKKLLNGEVGVSGQTTHGDVTFLGGTAATQAGTYAITVTTAAAKANVTSSVDFSAATIQAGEEGSLSINGQVIAIEVGDNRSAIISKINAESTKTGVQASASGDNIKLEQMSYGSSNTITVGGTAATLTAIGLTAGTTSNGADVAGTLNDGTATYTLAGSGATLLGTANTPTEGLSLRITAGAGAAGDVVITNDSLEFQVGANVGQLLKQSIGSVASNSLGVTATGLTNSWTSIADIDVTTSAGAQDAIRLLDAAISEVSTLRSELGASQKDLEANISSLGVAKENIAASESSIRDTDMAYEMVAFTRNQILLQAGTAMLTQANAAPQALLSLLR